VAVTIDARAVTRGALGAIGLFAPVALVLHALSGGDKDSNAWIPLVFVFLFAFMFGGWLAAYDRPATPLVHGASASAAGFAAVLVVVLLVKAIAGTASLGAVIAGIVFLEIAAGLGLVGGLLASKGVRVK
jgi:hypothetical protein